MSTNSKKKVSKKTQIVVFLVQGILVAVGIHTILGVIFGMAVLCTIGLGSCPSNIEFTLALGALSFIGLLVGLGYLARKKLAISAKLSIAAYLIGIILFLAYHSVWYLLDPYIKHYRQYQAHQRLLDDWDNIKIGMHRIEAKDEGDAFSIDEGKSFSLSVITSVEVTDSVLPKSLDRLYKVEYPEFKDTNGNLCKNIHISNDGYMRLYLPDKTELLSPNKVYQISQFVRFIGKEDDPCNNIKIFNEIRPEDIKIIKIPKEQL
jgi:hypothetical protein